jgi:hypothetical protein
MIKYHHVNSITIAEILPETVTITTPQDMLDIMADIGYNDCNAIIINDKSLHNDFFILKSGLAGEILQKFSNYKMRLAIIGDFSKYKSKSLNDFIRESNRMRTICFVDSLEEALSRLDH